MKQFSALLISILLVFVLILSGCEFGSSGANSSSTVCTGAGVDYVDGTKQIGGADEIVGDPIGGRTFTVKNFGDTDGSVNFSVSIYISPDQTYDAGFDVLTGSAFTIPPIPANGESAEQNIEGTWPAAPGTYYLLMVVDAPEEEEACQSDLEYVFGPYNVYIPREPVAT